MINCDENPSEIKLLSNCDISKIGLGGGGVGWMDGWMDLICRPLALPVAATFGRTHHARKFDLGFPPFLGFLVYKVTIRQEILVVPLHFLILMPSCGERYVEIYFFF